ncbi:MAG: LPS-assembly protein LptD [Bacteroidaceae bacterium]|nr:LPS-assembly protein LptD [Bacteroidaceae bacterium]
MKKLLYIFAALLVSLNAWTSLLGFQTHKPAETSLKPQKSLAADRQDNSAVPQSLPPAPIDSLNDSLINVHDSLYFAQLEQRMATAPNTQRANVRDSLVVSTDTIPSDSLKKKREAGIDAPVHYTAADSMVYDAETGLIFLYGKANVKYQNMELEAASIRMNMDSSLVHALAATDTAGVMTDKPTFHQGSDEYVSEEMAFNFRTRKGFIQHVSTTQGNGYVQSMESKRDSSGIVYMRRGTYTTCDAEHPHFYIALSRAKLRPGKDVVFGPAYLVVEDVPLPLAIPYGFFPFNKKYSSGFIMPSYGDETSRGFYLRDGGYYFAINDYFDLRVTGEIYTKGSWGLNFETNYRKRYRHNGNLFFSYLRTVEGERNMPDYSVTKSIKLQWSHTKDPKSSPNTTFTARVNFASESYEQSNLTSMYNPLAYTQSTRSSAVSYSHTFPTIGLSLSLSTNLTQNLRDSSIVMTLPELSISLPRIYPFRRKNQVGKERWYEKISISYTGNLSNSINTSEDQLLKSNLIKDWRNGMQHRIPIDATFQVFKYINVSPSISLRDYMYTNRVKKSWDETNQRELTDTTYGFYNLYDWNVSLSANTTLYGMYKPLPFFFGKKIIAIRHVLKPSVSFSYSPDFTTESYGYFDSYVRTDADGNVSTVTYSPYQNGIYGYPSSGKQGMISFSLSNNLEMKIRSERDSTGERKISLIDELYGSLSYNMAAKVRPWSDLSTRLRLKISKSYTFSLAAVFATYAYVFNDKGQVVVGDRTEWSYGRFGRFQGMSQSISYTLNAQKIRKFWNWITGHGDRNRPESQRTQQASNDDEAEAEANLDPELRQGGRQQPKKVKASVDEDGYMTFSIPWNLSFSYGITMYEDRTKQINTRNMRYPYSFRQTLNCSGSVSISDGWNISFASGYDFNNHELSMTTASLSRDLHCFEMSASVVIKPFTSFNFSFRAKANELTDALKWDKRSSYSSNIEWY